MNSDAKDFLTFVQGYHQLFCGASDLIKLDEDHRPSANAPHTPPILSKTFKVDINEVSAISSNIFVAHKPTMDIMPKACCRVYCGLMLCTNTIAFNMR